MNIRFDNKTILITGATAGIGLAAAELFASLGGNVAICGTRQARLDAALDQVRQSGPNVWGRLCDVADDQALTDFTTETRERFGTLDVWIGNAAVYPQYSIIDTPPDVWDKALSTNLRPAYLGARLARDMMGPGGVLLLASSFAALMPSIGSGVYAATKAAISSMVKTLAAELAPYGVRVNGYIPGVIATELTGGVISENGEAMKQAIALRRFGEPIDVAWSLAFLASDYARYVTGTLVEISGGKLGVQNPGKAWTDAAKRGNNKSMRD